MKKYGFIVIILITILIAVINNIKIFTFSSQNSEYVFDVLSSKYDLQNTDICILKYSYTTGAGWKVEKSTNEEIENKYVYLNTICNPRDLKENEDFALDYMARLVVAIDKIDKFVEIAEEKTEVIYSKEIVVTDYSYGDAENGTLKFKNLTFIGKIKSMLAIFMPDLRIN